VTLRFTRVTFRDDAVEDLRRLAERSRTTLLEVFRLLKALDAGSLSPVPLHDYAKTGDLTDCGKIVVAVEGEPEHRIVVRDRGKGAFEVSEVIAVEDRTADLPYLLAGLRLGRLEDPIRRSDAQRRVARIRQLRDR
jgi:hypothetical protein